MECNEFTELIKELSKGMEILERNELYTCAFIILSKLVFAKIDYELCLKGIIIRSHNDRFKILEEYKYDEKFKKLYTCYSTIFGKYRGAYKKIITKGEFENYKKLVEECLK